MELDTQQRKLLKLPEWFVYSAVLIAAASHASWNFIVKASADRILTTAGMRFFGLLIALVLLLFAPWPAAAAIPYLLGQVCFACAYYFFLLNSYRTGEFSAVYPIARGLAPVSVLMAAVVFEVDPLTSGELIATVLISLGILLFATTLTNNLTSFGYAIATGLMIGAYTFLAGLGVRHSESVVGYLAWTEVLIGLVIVSTCWSLRRGSISAHLVSQWPTLLFAAVLSAGAFGIVLWAFQSLPLGPVTAVRETSVAFAVLLGVVLLKEKLSNSKICALISILLGMMVLALHR